MIRIYALAKELGVDNKEIVEICQKVGLEGKRSALASLSDEDVALVKNFMDKEPSHPSVKEILAGGDAPMQRPTVSLQSGKVPVLKPLRPVKKAKEETAEIEPPVPEVVQPQETESEEIIVKIADEEEATPAAVKIEPIPAAEPEISTEPTESVKPEKIPEAPERPSIHDAILNKDVNRKIPVLVRPTPKKEKSVVSSEKMATDVQSSKSLLTESSQSESTSSKAPSQPTPPTETVATAPVMETSEPPVTSDTPIEPTPVVTEKVKKSSPLKTLLHLGKKKEEPAVSPATPEPAPAPVEEKPAEEELSPLEMARRAAAAERERRPHVIGPMGESGKKKKKEEDGKSGHAKKSTVAIRLAPLPTATEKPTLKRDKNEPAPQKPEIRLGPGAMIKGKDGTSPLTRIIAESQKGKDSLSEKGEIKGRDAKKKKIVGDIDSEIEEIRAKKKKGGKGRGDEVVEEAVGRKRRAGGSDFSHSHDDDSFGYYQRQHRKKGTKTKVSTVPRKGDIVIELPCTVKGFAEATGLSVAVVIKKMMELGYMLTINQAMDDEIAEMLVEAFELKAVVKQEQSLEDQFVNAVMDQEDPPETLKPRPPVVTFLGHVDHGKTSLLDRILHMNVVSGEKGGITQHIRSYRIKTKGGDVTFVDTPGHEAFTEMRARGANCTDIAVLVVAADDGVMPQTEEAISHAKAAGVPIVVALNKMDLPGVSRDRVVQELAANDLMPSEWGGDVEIVETSATTGMGIEQLMETLLMVAELHELKARPDRPAAGVAIESSLEPGQGVLCTLLVQNGTLKTGDIVLCGNAYGKIRAMTDTLDPTKEIVEAGPSTPVVALGFDVAPSAGSQFVVLDDISVARQIAEERTQILHQRELTGGESHVTLENLRERLLDSKSQQTLNVIIRTDVRGSIEAIRKELSKLDHPEVKIKILQASVGGITEADVLLADASDAIVVGFNVVPDELARSVAEKKKVQIRRYDIIYKLSEDIKAALEGMLKPIEQVKELGRAFVQQTFSISRIGTIAGCRVLSGTVERDCRVRLIRDSRVIGEYVLDTLKREKDDTREVREGYECGIKLKGYNDVKEGDIFEAYKIEEIARTF